MLKPRLLSEMAAYDDASDTSQALPLATASDSVVDEVEVSLWVWVWLDDALRWSTCCPRSDRRSRSCSSTACQGRGHTLRGARHSLPLLVQSYLDEELKLQPSPH